MACIPRLGLRHRAGPRAGSGPGEDRVGNAEVPAQPLDGVGLFARAGAQAVIDGNRLGANAGRGAPFGGKDQQCG